MKISQKIAIPLAAFALVAAGAATTVAFQSHAQTSSDAIAANPTQSPQHHRQFDPTKGGHVGSNGVREELLTGTTADQAKAAALAAVPGGTIQRVETDAEGAAYEAHMLKSDGSPITVKMDASFHVTSTEDGPAHR